MKLYYILSPGSSDATECNDIINLLTMERMSEISRERNRSHASKILLENDVVSEKLLNSRF